MKDNLLSVIIPAYNESERIGITLSSIEHYFKHRNYLFEVIVVDDGSTDNTVAIVQNCKKTMPYLKLISNGKNRGKGYSVRNGMLNARGSLRLFMDADNSVDISHIDKFIRQTEKGFDVVIGSIRVGHARVSEHNGWHRRILGELAKILIQTVATPGIHDTQRGFKLFTETAARAIFPRQTIERFGFDIELIVLARMNNFKIKELPVVWRNPAGSKVTLRSYIETFRELANILKNRFLGTYKEPVSGMLEKHNVAGALFDN